MFNQKILKATLIGSWLLLLFTFTPWAPEASIPAAVIVLVASYFLCAFVLGATDSETHEASIKKIDDAVSQANIAVLAANKAAGDAKAEAARVSSAISEMRNLLDR